MPRINAFELDKSLRERLAPVYLVSGDELLIVDESIAAIRRATRKAGFAEHHVHHLDSASVWTQVNTSVRNQSLLAAQRLVELRSTQGAIGNPGRRILTELFATLDGNCILLLRTPRLESSEQKRTWYKELLRIGVHVPVWPVEPRNMPAWLRRRAASMGLKITPEACHAFCGLVEGNLLAAVQELGKLKSLDAKRTWDTDALHQVVKDSSHYRIFDLLDAALAGRLAHSLKILHVLERDQHPPLQVLGLLYRELVTLHRMALAVRKGGSPSQVAREHRVLWKRTELVKGALQHLEPEDVERLIAHLTLADQAAKGLLLTDVWQVLRELVADLAQLRRKRVFHTPASRIAASIIYKPQ